MSKNLQLLESDNPNRHRVTIAKDRVCIKFRKGSDDAEKAKVGEFFVNVAKDAENAPRTIRGTLRVGRRELTMYNSSNRIHKTYEMPNDTNESSS